MSTALPAPGAAAPTRVATTPSSPTASSLKPSSTRNAAPAGGFFSGPLGQMLFTFKREFVWVVIFSAFANLLMLTPTLYMLQVFDRVMVSGNGYTLVSLTVALVFLLAVLSFSEWLRLRHLCCEGGGKHTPVQRFIKTRAGTH